MSRQLIPRPSRAGLARLREHDGALGAVVVLIVVALLASLGWLYLRPPGQRTIEFETADVSSITAGQDVRVAGIRVGKVTDVAIEQQLVRVTASIDSGTVVGNLSRVEVRMLTPVGGYAVTLVPLGTEPLRGAIPSERVRVPYTIGDTLQLVPKVTDDVQSPTVQANLTEVSNALADNPSSLRTIVDGLNSVVGVLARQREQVHSIAQIAQEYSEQFNGNRDFLITLIKKIDLVLTTYNNSQPGFNLAIFQFADVLARTQPIMRFYLDRSDDIRGHVEYLRDAAVRLKDQIEPMVNGLTALRASLVGLAGSDPAATNPLGTLCIPVPGRTC